VCVCLSMRICVCVCVCVCVFTGVNLLVRTRFVFCWPRRSCMCMNCMHVSVPWAAGLYMFGAPIALTPVHACKVYML